MAAQTSALTDQLVEVITGFDPKTNARAYKTCRDLAARGLRSHQYLRINESDVRTQLEGLEEKFTVRNREDLTNALHSRLEELWPIRNRWNADILSLLLHLSDKPVENVRLDDLEGLKPPASPPPLTWAEIIADDPLDEEGIWDDIDYGASSTSEDENDVLPKGGKHPRGDASRVHDTELTAKAADLVLKPDMDKWAARFGQLSSDQDLLKSASSAGDRITATELQLIRESIFFLQGLPSSLYETITTGNHAHISLEHIDHRTLDALLATVCRQAEQLNRLRSWLSKQQTVPAVQALQAAVEIRYQAFKHSLCAVEQSLVAPPQPVTVSILDVLAKIETVSADILEVARIIQAASPSESMGNTNLQYFEALYEAVCREQYTMSDPDQKRFRYLASLFLSTFQALLKPIRLWVETGELDETDSGMFFVSIADKNADLSTLWHNAYTLNNERVPSFFRSVAGAVFSTGKSIRMLEELGQQILEHNDAAAFPANLSGLYASPEEMELVPFSEIFSQRLQSWVDSRYHVASTSLRQVLENDCGLYRSIGAMEHVYFSANGYYFLAFAENLFARMKNRRRAWADRFTLTELARETLGAAACVDARSIAVRVKGQPRSDHNVLAGLEDVTIEYALPWAVGNIMQSILVQQQIFILILQLQFVRFSLQETALHRDMNNSNHITLKAMYLLRSRLLWFINTVHYYVAEIVVKPETDRLRNDLKAAKGIDEMSQHYERYVAKLEYLCILSERLAPLLRVIKDILDIAINCVNGRTSQDTISPSSGKQRTRQDQDSDEDTEGSDDEAAGGNHGGSSDAVQIQSMLKEFHRLHGFLSAGLRSASRARGEPQWEMLAEMLNWAG